MVTKEYITGYFNTHTEQQNARFIGRALVVIFNNQTEEEKRASDVREDNGIGFTGADGHSGCITAKYFLKHGTLLDWQVDRWMKKNAKGTPRISKYWRQLDAAATAASSKPAKPVTKIETQIDADQLEKEMCLMEVEHDAEMHRQEYINKMSREWRVGR
jgi:hypothetical protein